MRTCRALVILPFVAASFAAAGETAAPDAGWTRWSPRPALAPRFTLESSDSGALRLGLEGGDSLYAVGAWRRVVPVASGASYRLRSEVRAAGVTSARQQVVCAVRWQGAAIGEDVAPEYVALVRGSDDGAFACDQTLTAPREATSAELSLGIQWAPGARVTFTGMSFAGTPPPAARIVRIATLYWRPSGPSTADRNLDAFATLVDRVASQKPDVILLSEAITSIGTGRTVSDAAQEPSGPAFQTLSAKARQHGTYIIYGAYEKAGALVYNSAFVIGRDGTLVGRYRKVQLPVGEIEAGLSPGDGYSTVDLDFGRAGILICHDSAFDEPARLLALDGAELLFVPAWGGDMTQLRARALDNGVWVVTAGYDVPSAVIDPAGEIRAQTWKQLGDGTALATVDLAQPVRRPWIGDWRSVALKQRRTETYRRLLEEPR